MIINSIRLLAFIILFVIIIIKDIPFKKIFKDAMIQLYIAIFCISILILIDNITGFILTLGALIIYFRIYSEELRKKNELEQKDSKGVETLVKGSDNNVNNVHTEEGKCKCNGHHEKCEKHGDKSKHSEHSEHEKCDKCTMDTPKKKNIFNETTDDNLVPYITEENLLAAQTNIVDISNYNLNIENSDLNNIDIKRGPLYKIQGLPDANELNGENSHVRGYDIHHQYLGQLPYDIL